MQNKLFNKRIIKEYLPNESAVAGVREFEYAAGPAKGVRALEVYTGNGFRFTVLPDRGMDIAEASYKGIPIAWMGKQGVHAPSFFQNGELEFLKVFFGGLMTTCGLVQAGAPCVDESIVYGKQAFGLHGRINAIPAENYSHYCEWDENDDYMIRIKGQVREASLYAENLVLHRQIETKMGSSAITVTDTVVNEGHMPTEFMLLYHLNVGYPIISEHTKLNTNYRGVEAINDFAKAKEERYKTFIKPVPEYLNDNYQLYDPDDDKVKVALFNEKVNLGVEISYSNMEMPFCTEWINMAAQDYVVGIEPGNCLPEGRMNARENGRLDVIKPGEEKTCKIEIRMIDSQGG